METYQLALLTAQTIGEHQRVVAGLLHHIAWLFRYRGMEAEEQRYLRFALEAYISVYEYEWQDQNDARLMYMIGELHRRLGEYNEAGNTSLASSGQADYGCGDDSGCAPAVAADARGDAGSGGWEGTPGEHADLI